MYTYCVIEWADDETIEEVIIKAFDDYDEDNPGNDDSIFFYGMSRDTLIECMENHTLCEGEWYVRNVLETVDEL